MRIGIPVEETQIAEEYSSAATFAIYDVNDDTRAVSFLGRQTIAEPGCGRTPASLKNHGVEVVLAHQISPNAINHLLEAGIVAIQDAPRLPPDALISHLVSGTLQARAPQTTAQESACGGGGCGHCSGGGHTHSHSHHHPADTIDANDCEDGCKH